MIPFRQAGGRTYVLDEQAAKKLKALLKAWDRNGPQIEKLLTLQGRNRRVRQPQPFLPMQLQDPIYRQEDAVEATQVYWNGTNDSTEVLEGDSVYEVRADYASSYYPKGMTVLARPNGRYWQIMSPGIEYARLTLDADLSAPSTRTQSVTLYDEVQDITFRATYGDSTSGNEIGIAWNDPNKQWDIVAEAC